MDAIPHSAPILHALLAPELGPLFWRPSRLGYDSAWTAHVPFAHWIVGATRPRMLVELGTHNGVSYAGFCEAVVQCQLATRCYAVDTWEGDEHAGLYGEEVYSDLRRFHDQRYAAFSDMLRCTFDAALEYMPDGSIDLLHIDGCHGYEAVRHDFESWLPKLSDRAVVLFHDTNVRERHFGVWRLFAELGERYPSFEFLHEHGLGVVAVGQNAPEDVAGLCAVRDPAVINAVRERFSQLGERWRFEVQLANATRDLKASNLRQHAVENDRMRARAAQRSAEARRSASVAYAEADRLSTELLAARHEIERLRQEASRLADERDGWARAHYEMASACAETVSARDWAAYDRDRFRAERDRLIAENQRIGQELAQRRRTAAPPRSAIRRKLRTGARMAWWAASLQLRRRMRQRARLRHELALLAGSHLFSPGWYLNHYPDVAASDVDPALHYLERGLAERRNPGPLFDSASYLASYPDVAGSGMAPLIHYLRHGAAEGRMIQPVDEPVTAAPPPPPARVELPIPLLRPPAIMPPPAPGDVPAPPAPPTTALRLLYLIGEAGTPGAVYRVIRPGRAAERAGASVTRYPVTEAIARRDDILAADVVVIWRAAWNPDVAAALEAARQSGAKVVFDVDDLMVEPDVARLDVIDGIRTQLIPEQSARDHFTRVRDTMAQCEFCIAPTDELAWHMRRHGKPTFVLPNGYDEDTLRVSRRAVRQRRREPRDGLFRIGYAVGSRTHQKDFAVAAESVGRILREYPHCRLVLFTSHIDFMPLLDISEFPALAGLEARIEWRMIVPLAQLPTELARFDVNLAPLEVGNEFCEAKSELKYFEAALVDVVTIASPTGPYARAIVPGVSGFLARGSDDWHHALRALVADPHLGPRMARAAYLGALWQYGPERRVEMMASILDQVRGGPAAAWAFALDAHRATMPRRSPQVPRGEVVFEADTLVDADVTVIVPLYNYAHHVIEALDSVRTQTLAALELIVIDDASTDDSLAVALDWVRRHAARFTRVAVLRNTANAGLGLTRNAGFAAAETPYVLPLDADNRLHPACCEALLAAANTSGAAFVYPVIQEFGEARGLMGSLPYAPARLVGVPYIDAMALVSVAAWACVGGYWDGRHGWEDYEFWCRMAEYGLNGQQVPGAPLADYRVHRGSMLQSVTEARHIKPLVMAEMARRHPWLSLVDARLHAAPAPVDAAAVGGLEALLPLLRCPETGQALRLDAAAGCLVSEDGTRRWPVVAGRPVLFSGLPMPNVLPDAHHSNPLPASALALIRDAGGPVLNLSAGGTAERLPNVIEAEAAIFRNTGVVADAHHLPFADAAFAGVVVLNAFEHYRDPRRVAAEILRVLRPGGRVLVHTAFLQPLHEAPAHYFNCTRYGLEEWFSAFDTERVFVSENFGPAYAVSWLAYEARAALDRDISTDAGRAFAATPVGQFADLWTDPAGRDADARWQDLQRLSEPSQEAIAAGFEYVGRRPLA